MNDNASIIQTLVQNNTTGVPNKTFRYDTNKTYVPHYSFSQILFLYTHLFMTLNCHVQLIG